MGRRTENSVAQRIGSGSGDAVHTAVVPPDRRRRRLDNPTDSCQAKAGRKDIGSTTLRQGHDAETTRLARQVGTHYYAARSRFSSRLVPEVVPTTHHLLIMLLLPAPLTPTLGVES